jgi:two-component system copper resistance phosphate regulon response regulator CusR
VTRLLLAEDEEGLGRSLEIGLREEGYIVDRAMDGEEALYHARVGQHDALILDLRMPRIDGWTVCRKLRAASSTLPILMLTACDTTPEIVEGLDAGADDYLTKPFDFDELLARLRALLRRGSRGAASILRIADLELDTARKTATCSGHLLALRPQEFQLLEFLLLHAGEVLSKERIAAALWDDEIGPDSNALEVHVSQLRRKLEQAGLPPLLHTRRRQGYLMSEDPPR